MQKRNALVLLLWMLTVVLFGCADERHVVKTPVPPPPQRTNITAQ
jgi:hypothetical protein